MVRNNPSGRFGKALAAWMADAGLASSDLARRIDVSPAQVSRWLSANQRPSDALLRRLVGLTGGAVTYEDVLGTPRIRRAQATADAGSGGSDSRSGG